MSLVVMKLCNFKEYSKLQEFIAHLENIPEIVNFIIAGDALLLEYEAVNSSIVFYYSKMDNAIIALGRDCEASRTVTDWDLEQLKLKRMVNKSFGL